MTGGESIEFLDGLERTTKKTLGEETIDFFDDNFPEDIEEEERDFLRRSLSPPPKDPTDEAKEFFNTHGERLAKDKKLLFTMGTSHLPSRRV